MYIHKIIFYINWMVSCKILHKKIPLNSSVIINDICNLNCEHCVVANLGYDVQKYSEITEQIDILYSLGSKMLVLTGGEPFLWKDGEYTLDNIIRYARYRGFFRTVVCTNGTFDLRSRADYLWVSLDGFQSEHGKLRGNKVYREVVNNISESVHQKIYINFTISRLNIDNFEESVKHIIRYKNVKGILVHLVTPYLGLDSNNLVLSERERKSALKRLLKLKWKYPFKISNTFSGIKALLTDKWERPVWSSVVMNRKKLTDCCCREGIADENVCKICGCSPAVETWVLQKLKLLAFVENLRFL